MRPIDATPIIDRCSWMRIRPDGTIMNHTSKKDVVKFVFWLQHYLGLEKGYLGGYDALPVEDNFIKFDPLVTCKDCVYWDRDTIEKHDRCDNELEGHDPRQADFAECQRFSTWDRSWLLRSDDFCSLGERRSADE